MFRRLSQLAAVVTILLFLAPGVEAITFGIPDGDMHPNVGVMLAAQGGSPLYEICTGTLIAPTVFLTAAHCVNWMEGDDPAWDVWVSFDPTPDAGSALIPGTPQPNPAYGHDQHDMHDVAVVLLAYAPEGIAPAQLPAAGLLDALKDDHTLDDQSFVTVGYGALRDDKARGPQAIEWANADRFYVEQSFLALRPAWIQLSMNPATGSGGSCYGDSGGPHFLGDTDIVVAITVDGDAFCRATDLDYRMDTESARSYLGQFVDLP